MAAKMEKTDTPGIYRRGSRFVVVYLDGEGRQRKESAPNITAAKRLKAARSTDRDRGEFQAQSRITFREYAEAWVERYQGNGRRGFRESTRDDYRRLLSEFAYPHFGRLRLTQITPKHVADYISLLCDERKVGRHLSDSTVRNAFNPVRSCLATAKREGLIRHNPATEAALPHRERVEDDDEPEVRPLSREQLAAFLAVVHPRYRLMFRLLAATGLRVSEVLALQWRHLRLDGSEPCVRVRRALVRGRIQPPKSHHGRRDVPLDAALVSELRRHRAESEWPGDDDLVFPSLRGTPQLDGNVRNRYLRPAAEEAGASWAGFHTFRHTCASLLFERGANVKAVQRWLGHHSPSFTLDTYVHLLADRLPEPVNLQVELGVATQVATSADFGGAEVPGEEAADPAFQAESSTQPNPD